MLNKTLPKETFHSWSTTINFYFKRFAHFFLFISSRYITEMIEENNHNSLPSKFITLSKFLHFRICFYYTYTLVLVLRLFTTALILNLQIFLNFFAFDPLMDLFVQMGLVDRYLALVLWPSPFLFLYFDYLISFTRRLSCYYIVYDLLVLNRKNFWRLNPQLNIKNALPLLWTFKKRNNGVKLCKLEHTIPFEHSIRCRAVVVATAGDVFIASMMVLLGTLFSLAVYFLLEFAIKLHGVNSPEKVLIIFVEASLVMYVVWHGVKIALFLALILNLVIYVYVNQQRVANRRLEKLITSSNETHRKKWQLFTYIKERYLPAHFHELVDILHTDQQIVSQATMAILLTMLG